MLQVVALSLLLGQAPLAEGSARPGWIQALPDVPGRLYALGMADLGAGESRALARASDSARSAVVAQLRTSLRKETAKVTRTSELAQGDGSVSRSGESQVNNTLSVSTHAEDLPGLVVERTYVDPSARAAYALAYLDLGKARNALSDTLDRIHEDGERIGAERSRRARWRYRKLKGDLDRVDETLGLLSLTAVGAELRPRLQLERRSVEGRLRALDQGELPPLDFARLAVAIRVNTQLPSGLEEYLNFEIRACGAQPRTLAPDLILDLTFRGGDGGKPEFIFTDVDVYSGVSYCLAAKVRLLEQGGEPLGKTLPVEVCQNGTPEGMVKEFRRRIDQILPNLFAEFRKDLE